MARYRLGSICQIISGSTPKTGVQEYWNGDKKWITPAELSESDYIIYDTARKLTGAGVKSAGLTLLPKGTVILSSRAPIGKVAIAGCEMYCNQGFKNLVCTDVINNKYLYWYLRGKTDYLNSLGRGATFKEISKSTVSDIELNVPELTTQIERVAHLEKLQSIITCRRAQLAKLDELVKCRFVEMFGDPVTNTNQYEIASLDSIASYWNGLTYSPEDVSEEGTIVLRSSNIQNSTLDFKDTVRVNCRVTAKKFVQKNDILMCSRNGSAKLVGKVALIQRIKEPMAFGAFMMIIRSDLYYPYLMTYFQTPAFRLQIATGSTTTINQITGNMLDKVKLPVPPVSEVETFATFVRRIDKLRFAE